MGIEQDVLEKLRGLPPDRQREVLDFIEFLGKKAASARKSRSLKGLGADLGVHISQEEIDEVRRDLWGNFPRKDI